MKVFFADEFEDWEKLSKLGRCAIVENKGEKIEVKGEETFETEKPLQAVLEVLSILDYDFVALKGFKEARIGVPVKKAKSVEDVVNVEDFETLHSITRKLKERGETCGALGIFVGFVREISEGKKVVKLEYERFDELYFEKLKEIERVVENKYEGVRGVKIYHKVGDVLPREDIVYVCVMAEHRKNLWNALVEAVELFKKELPIWKKEVYEDGEVWAHDRDLKKSG